MVQEISKIIQKEVGEKINFNVEASENPQFGHYATNLALRLSGVLKRPPIEIARDLAERFKANYGDFFEKVEATPPGFINFWLASKILRQELAEILAQGKKYGRSAIGKGKKVQVEFVSANPTGPLTLANGRGGFLGDALSSLLEFSGHRVEREYYVNDTGNQILTFGKSLLAAQGFMPAEENFYKGEYVKEWARSHKDFLARNQKNAIRVGERAAKDFLSAIKKVLKEKAGIKFDRWTSEARDIHKKGLVKKALKILKQRKLVYERDGALWLRTTDLGDDKDRVLVTSDKFPTYFLADAGHYLETKRRGFDRKINILGPDHYGYVKRIQAAAQILGFKNSETIVTQAIRLVKGGEEVKMSKRRGQFVTFEGLVEEVGADAARFFFLMHAPETHMDFDLDLAKERSAKNPVYYAQYAYVRAGNIIKKAKAQVKKAAIDLVPLKSEAELNLIRELVKFSDLILETALDYRVHRLTKYSLDVARTFHNFYERERVIGEAEELKTARLGLVRGTRQILGALFDLLGITKLDKM